MLSFIARRAAQSVIALLLLMVVVFGLARMTGDPISMMLPVEATPEDYARVTRIMGLDRPLYEQFYRFTTEAFKGDLGKSIKYRRPVSDLVSERLPNSMQLAAAAIAIALILSFPLGVVSAIRRSSWLDVAVGLIAVSGQCLPAFWVGILLIQFFGLGLGLLPLGGIGGVEYYVLPAFTLALFIVAGLVRLLRSGMIDVLGTEYVKFARIKGLSEGAVIWKHALRNALIPVVTFAGMYFAITITAAIVVEVVFSWPGMGRLAYEGIINRDYPVVQGVVMTAGAIVIVVNLLVDISYAFIDPRIRHGMR